MAPLSTRLALRLAGGAAAAVLIGAGLTGCASSAGVGGCGAAPSGVQSESITAAAKFGVAPKVTYPLPLHASRTEVSTLIPGSGDGITSQQDIVADLTILNGTTGAVVSTTGYGAVASAATFTVGTVPLKGIATALRCAQVGSRIAMVVPPNDGFTAATRPPTVKASDSLVVVADVRRAYLARANGANQVMAAGLPSVVLAPNGQPGITLPGGPPPKTLQVDDLKKGSGAVVHAGDTVIVHYTGVLWDIGDVFDSSWSSGSPAVLPLKSGSVIKGFLTALSGQRVGSQVLAVLPPSQAYGATAQGSVPANATLVFVVDVLGKQ